MAERVQTIADVINSHDLCVLLGVEGYAATKDRGKIATIPRRAINSWDGLTQGKPMRRVTAGRQLFVDVWLPAEIAGPLAGQQTKHGKLSVSEIGRPCEVVISKDEGRWTSHHGCNRPAVGTVNDWGREVRGCNLHVKAQERRVAKDREWREQYDAETAQRQRDKEADRAAREMLEAHTELLEDLGIRDLRTDGAGHVRNLTVEDLVGLLRRIQ